MLHDRAVRVLVLLKIIIIIVYLAAMVAFRVMVAAAAVATAAAVGDGPGQPPERQSQGLVTALNSQCPAYWVAACPGVACTPLSTPSSNHKEVMAFHADEPHGAWVHYNPGIVTTILTYPSGRGDNSDPNRTGLSCWAHKHGVRPAVLLIAALPRERNNRCTWSRLLPLPNVVTPSAHERACHDNVMHKLTASCNRLDPCRVHGLRRLTRRSTRAAAAQCNTPRGLAAGRARVGRAVPVDRRS